MGGTVSSDGILDNLTPVVAGGELDVNDAPVIVDASSHTITIGNQAYKLGDLLSLLSRGITTTVYASFFLHCRQ